MSGMYKRDSGELFQVKGGRQVKTEGRAMSFGKRKAFSGARDSTQLRGIFGVPRKKFRRKPAE
jgi:hypothetical protein